MKLFALRLAAASLTFGVGVTIATLLLYEKTSSALNKLGSVALARTPLLQPTRSSDLADEYDEPLAAHVIKSDKLSYAGYDIERRFDQANDVSLATIKKNGKPLLKFSNAGSGIDSTEIGLFPFIGGEPKQLFTMQYTGGAHCCWIYQIYELTPTLRRLFDGEEYENIGYELYPIDLDHDGIYEFTQSVMSFDYFVYLSHASSVFPRAVFSYDARKKEYLPANRKFSDYVFEGIEEDFHKLEVARKETGPLDVMNERYLSAVLQILLKYIYAGREREGWEFFDREYQLSNKSEIKTDVRKALTTEPVYQSIYY